MLLGYSLVAFNILSLCLIFAFKSLCFNHSLITVCLGMFLPGFILYGTLCPSWTWLIISFSTLGQFWTKMSSKIFSCSFFFSFSSGTPIIQILVHMISSQRSQTILSSFHSFYFILLLRIYFHHFIFQLWFFSFSYCAIDSF